MAHPIPMTSQRKASIWQLWKAGKPMIEIARSIEKPPATVFSYLQYHGGIMPRPRTRRASSLSVHEREEISRGLVNGRSLRSLALQLKRSPSTISREVMRNGGGARYRAIEADQATWKRAKRRKPYLLAANSELNALVTGKLADNWSPEQISGWLKLTYPNDNLLRISHETIYKSLFIQTRGLFKKEILNHLRSKRKFRHSKDHRTASLGQIVDAVSISERPPKIEDRAVPGHWEGDLIQGANNSYIATVVERQSRFVVLVKVRGKDTRSVVAALTKQMLKLPKLLFQSLTWDRGTELSLHRQFALATNMDVFFCDPGSPWQRGTNENTNGLLRQYFPKQASLAGYSQAYLNRVAAKLNTRPRKTLGFLTPADKLDVVLH